MKEKFTIEFMCSLPWCDAKTLRFTLASAERGLKGATVMNYIRRVSSIQQLAGGPGVNISPWVKKVIQGMKNLEEERPTRLAVTPAVLKQIRSALERSNWSRERRRLFWATCCLMFHGSLR